MPRTLSPTQALSDLLGFIEASHLCDMQIEGRAVRSEELNGYLTRAKNALAAELPKLSPFIRHRDVILGRYSTATWLQRVVMSLWNGGIYPVRLDRVGGCDRHHQLVALELIEHYASHGENDDAFMSLAKEILQRWDDEAAEAARVEREKNDDG